MTPREWVSATWAEWCPVFSPWRVSVGPVVLMTRKEISKTFWRGFESGRDEERRNPTPEPEPEPLANVRYLHRV